MARKSWTLTDAEQNVNVSQIAIGPRDVGGACEYSVHKRTLHGGLREGVDEVEINNGLLRFSVLPTRGMGLWKAWLGPLEIGWKSPVHGPVHPQFVPVSDPGGLGWLDGFDELVCRCGLESNGAPDFDERGVLKYPLHGKIANRPAHRVELSIDPDARQIALSGRVDETRFHFSKLRLSSTISTTFGEPSLRIVDEVTNLSARPAEAQMLYHINLGQPLLDPGSRLVAPVKTLAPRDAVAGAAVAQWNEYGNEQPGFAEQVYFFDLIDDAHGFSPVLLKNAHGSHGATVRFRKQQLPCFIVWKNTTAAADGYVTGLEPSTNFPNPRSFETKQGRVVKLEPRQSVRFEVELIFHGDAQSVASAEQAITALQADTKPEILKAPKAGWSPG